MSHLKSLFNNAKIGIIKSANSCNNVILTYFYMHKNTIMSKLLVRT